MKVLSLTISFLVHFAFFVQATNTHADRNLRRQHYGHPNGTTTSLQKRFTNAKWSWYDTEETGQPGACGRHIKNNEFVVARAHVDFKPSDCFKQITLQYEGRTAIATIGDVCMKCPPNGLDLSMGLFKHIAPNGDGIVYGDWTFGASAEEPKPPPVTTKITTKAQPTPTTTTRSRTRTSTTPTTTSSSTTATSEAVATPTETPPSSFRAASPSGNLAIVNSVFVDIGRLILSEASN